MALFRGIYTSGSCALPGDHGVNDHSTCSGTGLVRLKGHMIWSCQNTMLVISYSESFVVLSSNCGYFAQTLDITTWHTLQ